MARKTATSDTQPASYGDAVQQLEQIVSGLESGQMPLEDLLTQYQRGTELLTYCRDRLRAIEDQVKVLDESGALKPWTLE
ncbi:exodeoxyribonuclease VII small subunit [Ottowia sp. GY511]|uniref:Exodeoxyribonuclease 7 small subunit n=1 Tax=Ottowia flava TaxID=2675430 RepID=A0ABW4KSY7_9BURK|nr:exodeoxyribonuclease VII small subunit [Ottowia sp. GY511]TXK24688.1 exodeoxyribonuclease VII small subunit [Ottowia sp. GY511]